MNQQHPSWPIGRPNENEESLQQYNLPPSFSLIIALSHYAETSSP